METNTTDPVSELDAQTLAERYIALWTEPDEQLRRATVRALWAPDGAHVLLPPAEMVAAAAALGFDALTLEAHGHAAIETRVGRSYERFVATGEYTFRVRGGAARAGDVVKFEWESVRLDGDVVTGGGLEVLQLGADGTIVRDTMFPR